MAAGVLRVNPGVELKGVDVGEEGVEIDPNGTPLHSRIRASR
jgi:hypothetical protein